MLVPMKIAEGCGQDSNQQFIHCLQQSRAASVDLEYLLLLARDLQLLEQDIYIKLEADLIEVRKMLSGLMRSKSEAAV